MQRAHCRMRRARLHGMRASYDMQHAAGIACNMRLQHTALGRSIVGADAAHDRHATDMQRCMRPAAGPHGAPALPYGVETLHVAPAFIAGCVLRARCTVCCTLAGARADARAASERVAAGDRRLVRRAQACNPTNRHLNESVHRMCHPSHVACCVLHVSDANISLCCPVADGVGPAGVRPTADLAPCAPISYLCMLVGVIRCTACVPCTAGLTHLGGASAASQLHRPQ